jgi:polysaccharide export outer membrane protein
MKCAKVSIIFLLAQSLACLAQDENAVTKTPSPSTQEPAVSELAREADSAAKPAESAPESYKIGAGDLLTITVWKETTLTGSYLVRPDGMISMPLLGDVRASVLTPLQLAGDLETKLKKFIQNPSVTVQIGQIHSKVIYLLGEVAKKGPIDMTPEMTLLQAISSAGGLTDYANAKKIYILRNDSGKQMKIPVHYKEALKGDGSLNLALQPGDTIVVP